MLSFEFLIIQDMKLGKVAPLMNMINGLGDSQDLVFRASFYSNAIDTEACPVNYTTEKLLKVSEMQAGADVSLNWVDKDLPNLVTAYNSAEVAAESSIMMLLWCRPAEFQWKDQETLVGQARISLSDMTDSRQSSTSLASGVAYSFQVGSL